jgi:hypothetical protein
LRLLGSCCCICIQVGCSCPCMALHAHNVLPCSCNAHSQCRTFCCMRSTTYSIPLSECLH